MFVVPEQMLALPLMVPGVAGVLVAVTANVCAEDVPQELLAATVMLPLVALAVVVIVDVVDAPVQPLGNVQV